jgi:colicin import membrane protein
MSSAALAHDTLLPRSPGGNGPGAALALLVHAGLITALTLGVDWRTHSPEVVSAELWAAVPQSVAPPPAPPPPVAEPAPRPVPAPPPVERTAPPPQPPPDISIERERERKKLELERKKAEAEAEADRKRAAEKQKDEDLKKRTQLEAQRQAQEKAKAAAKEQAEDDRLARQREENLRRMLGQAGATAGATPGATGPVGTAAQNAAPSASYAGKVKAAVRPNLVFTGMAEFNAAAEVEVTAAPGGSIIARRLIKSSGYKDWDEAVLRAIDKTRSLPRDADGRVPSTLIIAFRPNE